MAYFKLDRKEYAEFTMYYRNPERKETVIDENSSTTNAVDVRTLTG